MTANANADPPPERSFRTTKALEGVRVLVVDDDPDGRELVGIILEQHGASATLVGSAVEAHERLGEQSQDVLICDIGMPGEDGYSLINKLRTCPPERGGQIPAIALTAFSLPESHRSLQSGFQMYLSKPFEPSNLVAAVFRLSRKSNSQIQHHL